MKKDTRSYLRKIFVIIVLLILMSFLVGASSILVFRIVVGTESFVFKSIIVGFYLLMLDFILGVNISEIEKGGD